jgi:hypothetical protein
MNVDELRKGIALTIKEIRANLPQEASRVGADASALIEERVVERGERADGGRFSAYSTKPVPAFFYFGKSRNGGGETAVRKAAKQGEEVSYSDFRRFNGLGTSVKNFQFTGEMWQGFGVKQITTIGEDVVEIEIGGKNARSSLLLKAHSEREGSELTKNSAGELEQITKGVNDRISAIIKRNMT